MILTRLQLYQFRNYAAQTLDLGRNANLVLGSNGQGKTNLLEAVTMLATSRSPRAGRDAELITWDATEGRVWGEVVRERQPNIELEVRLSAEEGKRVLVNKSPLPRVVDLIGQINLVTFWVEDIEIVRGDPSQRRRFLNTEISQVSPQYCYQLAGYRRVLEQRNRLLKQLASRGTSSGGSLTVWNQQLVAYGAPIIERRREFLSRLQAPATQAHSGLTDDAERLELVYLPSFELGDSVHERYAEQLEHGVDEEIRRGVTLFGPHRDDVRFLLNGRDARVYGSLGQQRSVALSLRMAELKLVREMIDEEPILVMDDIFAELDRQRMERLMERVLPGRQSLTVTTEAARLPSGGLESAKRFTVTAGVIHEDRAGEAEEVVL